MRCYRFTLFTMILFIGIIGLNGCESSTEPGPHDGDPAQQLIGEWIGVFDEPMVGPMEMDYDAIFMDINATDFRMVFFDGPDQVTGLVAEYDFDGASEMIITFTHAWLEEEADWVQVPDEAFGEDEVLEINLSDDGNTMVITDPDGLEFSVYKRDLSIPEAIAGEWSGGGVLLSIESTGDLEAMTPDGRDSGYLRSIENVNGNDYLLLHITESDVEADGDCSIYKLFAFELNPAGDELTLHAGDMVLVLNPLEPAEGDELVGHWLGIFDQAMLGPGDKDCNAIYFEFDETDFMLLSFLDSDPAAGHKGTYTFEYQGALELNLTHNMSEEVYGWVASEHTAVLPMRTSSDGNTMYADGPDMQSLEIQKAVRDLPGDLAGEWSMPGASLTIQATGEFHWEQDGGVQSGTLWDLGEVNGESYWLINITYDEFLAQGESDYYTLNKYELNPAGDRLTFWHGEYEFVMELET